jgi:hypothetical protein
MVNPEPFLLPGIILMVIGMALAIYDGATSVNDYNKQQAEAAKR